eukprot:TCALIF_03394-PB protein Name:"Similar to TMEM199 Transmembrane protein 199 (Pongo abelii)" AED:0.10 eAED:0.10 QI:0/0.6/0.33/0.83/0.4/0.5/6/1385/419
MYECARCAHLHRIASLRLSFRIVHPPPSRLASGLSDLESILGSVGRHPSSPIRSRCGLIVMSKDLSDIHARLFNHRPFVQGEVRHFVREFEDQRGDREVERVFRVLERVTELRDEHVDQVQVAAQAALPGLQAKLARTRTLYQHILDPNRTLEIAKASENSKHIRAREWQEFEQDLDLQRKRVTEAYQAQAIDLQPPVPPFTMSVTIDPRIFIQPSTHLLQLIANSEAGLGSELDQLKKALDGTDSRMEVGHVRLLHQCLRDGQLSADQPFHALLADCHMILPEPRFPPRDPELEARIQRLRAQQANRDYQNMTRNINQKDIMSSLMSDDEPLSKQFKEINNYLLLIIQFVLSVGTSFVAGYLFPYYFYGIVDVGKRLLVGIILAFVVAMADLYFVIRFFLETDGVINVTGKRDKLKNS